MIKFFRKIRHRLLTENKFSKYLLYAIGEIVLVVIGILIALSINNWNENRKEITQEQKILKAIYSDFSFNQLEIDQNIEETKRTVAGTDRALELFQRANKDINMATADNALRTLMSFSTFHPSEGALNDLINAGHLNIIKNDSLRDKLSNWNSLVVDVVEDEGYLLEFINKYVEPVKLDAIPYNTSSRFKRNPVDYFNDPRFENIVSRLNALANYQIRLYASLKIEITEIQQMLQKEIQ